MTNEELDRARVDEAIRTGNGIVGSVALIAARLAREAQEAEIERLRALVKDAYEEGWDDAAYGPETDDGDWLGSVSCAALQPKEGE